MSNHQAIKRRACCIQSKSSVQKSGVVTRSDHAGRPFACLASWLCRCRTLHSSIHFSQHSRCTKLLQQTSPRSIDHQARPQAASGEAAAASLWDAQVVSNSMIWFKLIWYIYIYIQCTLEGKSGGLAMACLHRIEFDWALHQFAAKERRG